MRRITYIIIFWSLFTQAQEKDIEKAKKTSNDLIWKANKQLSEDKFSGAEADYRRAIAKNSKNTAAPYNLGNAYYANEIYSEAFGRFKQAGELAIDLTEKHRAYHNMGNVFMKNKEYQKAVEAYKEALRSDPKDEETRYNFALAKEMLKKEQDEQKNNENKDNKDDQDKKEQDKKDQNKDKENEGDNKKEDKGDKEKEENKKDDGDEKK